MLTKIREKAQGTFAAVILLMIGVPFVLWGINNYIDSAREAPVASVGGRDFYQRDLLRAYEQYSRALLGLGLDEATLKAQALDRLIKDEVLLQYAQHRHLVVGDDEVRTVIRELPYFQTDGQFDHQKYKSLLASQQLSAAEFVAQVRKGLLMRQLQDGIINSGFATTYDVERFFMIQNQQRDVAYLTIPLPKTTEKPSDAEIAAHYQEHKNQYQTPEQVAVEYVRLSMASIAAAVEVSDDKLQAFYADNKAQYTTPERRKISHILFAVNDKVSDSQALEKARQARQALADKPFAAVAAELSDDGATAKQGGDLGLFTAGVMEPAFDKAAAALALGEVSEPVRSSFGYHLIKVTELVPEQVKPFAQVREELAKAYQKAQAESRFYELAERMAELSFEQPGSLEAVAKALAVPVQKTGFFSADNGEGIAAHPKVRAAAFADEVKQGNNSDPIEIDAENLIVLRQLERRPAAVRELAQVRDEISALLSAQRAKAQVEAKAAQAKASLLAGKALSALAAENQWPLKQASALRRQNTELPAPFVQAVFKAAKPVAGRPTVVVVPLPNGDHMVASLTQVTEGVMTEQEKKQMELALKNIGKLHGQTEFAALIDNLQAKADISINLKPGQAN